MAPRDESSSNLRTGEEFANYRVISHLGRGGMGDVLLAEDQLPISESLDGGLTIEIPDVGHLIHYETPEAAATAIREFLA